MLYSLGTLEMTREEGPSWVEVLGYRFTHLPMLHVLFVIKPVVQFFMLCVKEAAKTLLLSACSS